MKQFLPLLIILITVSVLSYGQEKKPQKINWYGHINYESIFDSHESVTSRDGELYLFPKNTVKENPQLEMLALESRVGMKVSGPDLLGAKTMGKIEGDFLGTGETYKHMFRIRHAFMKMKWKKTSLLMGQYWHPMFTPEVFPRVLSFGAATLYNPLNRAPQIRVDYNATNDIRLTFAALGHGYHYSKGPAIGANGEEIDIEDDQRDAAVPDLQFQLLYGKSKSFTTGFTAGYMLLEPRVPTANQKINDTKIGSYNLEWYANYTSGNITAQAKAVYGQNMSQYIMLGGYGKALSDTTNIDNFGYTPFKIYSLWGEVYYKLNDQFTAGIFAGFSGNLGTADKVDTDHIYARGKNIMQLMRISPRVSYKVNQFRFGIEYLYDVAQYGTNTPDEYGIYDETQARSNHRFMLAARYYF